MVSGGAAFVSIAGGSIDRLVVCCAVALGSLAQATVAFAADTVDCAMINLGGLNVDLAPGSSALRTVKIEQGDILAFTFRASSKTVGNLVLIAGAGPERQLLHGPNGTQSLYAAEQSATVDLRLAARGRGNAAFYTTCTPAIAAEDNGVIASSAGGLDIDAGVPLSLHAPAATGAPAATDHSLEWLSSQPGAGADPNTLGVKLNLRPAIMVGVLAQFQPSDDALLGPRPLSEQSWQAGPVTKVQLGEGLVLDARAAWGPADPGQSPIDHAADRQLVDARLGSKQVFGRWRFSPSLGLNYQQEKTRAAAVEQPADSLGHQTVDSGRFDIRPEMAYRIDMGHSVFIEPRIMVGAFWNIGNSGVPGTSADADLRHMAETGITLGSTDGAKFQVGGAVEEGEPRAADVWTGRMQLNIPLE